MQVSLTLRVTSARPFVAGTGSPMPPGLDRRELDLPPGIAKTVAPGVSLPAGIARRFPPASQSPSQGAVA